MAKLPMLSAKEVIRILNQLGFKFIRQEGSHMFFEHSDGRTTIIPNHPGRDIGRGLLNKIIKHDLKLTHKKCSLRTLWDLAHKKQRHFLGDQEPDTPCGFSPWFLTREEFEKLI